MSKNKALAFMKMLAMTGDRYNPNMFKEKNKRKNKTKKKIIPKGLKEFIYGNTLIYALNKKNADRKALKQGLTTKKDSNFFLGHNNSLSNKGKSFHCAYPETRSLKNQNK